MIPKKLHQIWVGDKEMPEQFKEWAKEWKELNPDFEYKMWTVNEFGENKFIEKAIEMGDYRFVSDWMRANILYNEGGVYVDVDIKAFKPIREDLLENEFGLVKINQWWYQCGFLLASKGNKVIREVLDEYKYYDKVVKQYAKDKPIIVKNPEHSKETLFNFIWEDGSVYQRALLRAYTREELFINSIGLLEIRVDGLIFLEEDLFVFSPQHQDPKDYDLTTLIGMHRPKI